MRLYPAAFALLALSIPAMARAQSFTSSPVPTPGVVAFTFASPSMGVNYEIVVRTPPQAKSASGARFAALIVTDGYRVFLPALDAAQTLDGTGVIEPLFVVSVGVPMADGDTQWAVRRIYEFSTSWAMNDPFGKVVSSTCASIKSPPGRCVGGAPKFLDVIVDEIIPQLAQRFPIDTARMGLFGVSAGGFFASWAIFQDKSPFKNYIISSPAMAYGDGVGFKEEARYAASHKDLPVGVYVATGSLEIDDPFLEGIGQIASGHARLVAALRSRNYPGLRLFNEILPGLGHGDAAGTALVRGMRTLYAKKVK